jgi:hypothetical protein
MMKLADLPCHRNAMAGVITLGEDTFAVYL